MIWIFIGIIAIAITFALLGALSVKVSLLTLLLKVLFVIPFVAVLLYLWRRYINRKRKPLFHDLKPYAIEMEVKNDRH